MIIHVPLIIYKKNISLNDTCRRYMCNIAKLIIYLVRKWFLASPVNLYCIKFRKGGFVRWIKQNNPPNKDVFGWLHKITNYTIIIFEIKNYKMFPLYSYTKFSIPLRSHHWCTELRFDNFKFISVYLYDFNTPNYTLHFL